MIKREMIVRRVGGALHPDGDVSWEMFDKLPHDKQLVVTVHHPRNPDHLRKYWAVAGAVADADPGFDDREDADHWVRVMIPWMRDEYVLSDGRTAVRVRSISPATMTQDEFNKFYDRAIEMWAQRLGMDPEELGREGQKRAETRRAPAR